MRDKYGLWTQGEDRTVRNLHEAHTAWVEEGNSLRNNLKNYYNVEYPPIIAGPDESKIIEIIPPPPLHLIRLGPVNKIMDHLLKICPLGVEEFQEKLHIHRSEYFREAIISNMYILCIILIIGLKPLLNIQLFLLDDNIMQYP